ncbi:Hypothetical predicted protein [Lecanosticta acicola]|uniref:Phosphoglycerate mutase n=1 Tax=Lecanosticta acicola TaxID=111012 RepID=A0AAI8YR85_9PEZI|nr:Hypothetical predicted protein [Lecanosticta acicola]
MKRYGSLEVRKLVVTTNAVFLALLSAWYLLAGSWSTETITPEPDMGDIHEPSSSSGSGTFEFETVMGIFMQDDPSTDWTGFEYTNNNFGLINRSYPTDDPSSSSTTTAPWLRFAQYLHHLTTTSPANVQYKLLYLGRHGEGAHNVAEAKYGTAAWDAYWSKRDGDGELFWSDARLTETGKRQALAAGEFMGEMISSTEETEKGKGGKGGMPAPQAYFVSPLFRCLQTANVTFGSLKLPAGSKPFRPIIKELLREVLGEHTCDRRSTKTLISTNFSEWRFEAGFTERDELWEVDHRETAEEHDVRTRAFLEDLFGMEDEEDSGREGKEDGMVYVSLTSHSGAIASFLRVLGHREFALPTGGMIPVLVKATRVR